MFSTAPRSCTNMLGVSTLPPPLLIFISMSFDNVQLWLCFYIPALAAMSSKSRHNDFKPDPYHLHRSRRLSTLPPYDVRNMSDNVCPWTSLSSAGIYAALKDTEGVEILS
jgi:hypothetical protein